MKEKELKLRQDVAFIVVPLIFDLLLLIGALFLDGFLRIAFALLSIIFAAILLWQSRPMLKNFELTLTPKGITVKDFLGRTVRKVDWKSVEAAAAGYKRVWLLYTYSFYFRVKGDEDVMLALLTRVPDLTSKFQQFLKVFVRKKIPVQIVKV